MSNLPKNDLDDISAFAGAYPDPNQEAKTPKSATPQTESSGSEGSTDGQKSAKFTGEPVKPFTRLIGEESQLKTDRSVTETGQFQTVLETQGDTPNTTMPFVISEQTSNLSAGEPPPPKVESATTPLDDESATPAGKPPRKSVGIWRRILILLILFIVIFGLGFAAFRFLDEFMSRGKPITLTYWGLWEDEQFLKPVIEAYKKSHPRVEIVYTKQSVRQYRERLQAAIDRGEGPDIFRFHATWVPMLKNQLAPAGSTGYTSSEFSATFYPAAVKDLVIGGKIVGVPLMMEGLGLYYNEDLLRAAGVTPPTTWNEFLEAARTLTVKDETGKIITSGAALGTTNNVEHFSDIVALMMLQNGANLKNPISKEAQDALTFYRIFAEKPNNVWDETLDNSIIAFASGRVAMIFAPSWQVFTIKEMNPKLKFQIIPVPQLPGTQVTWASYWAEGVAVNSKFIDEAWEFLKFLSSKEQMTVLYSEQAKSRLFGEPYSRVDLAQTLINDPLVGAYIKQAPTAQSFFLSSRTFDNGINDRMIKYTEDGINSLAKGVSIEAVLETMSKGYSQVLSSYAVTTTAP